jgi:type I restriction enzyme R subunit
MITTPNTAEQYSSHIPALQTLVALGWGYLSAAKCLAMRGSNKEVILQSILIDELKKRRFEYKGQLYPLSPNAIDQIVRELGSPPMHEGLLTASAKLYHMLTLGITVTEFIDGKKHSPTIPIILWDRPEQNSFVVTEEFEVLASDGTHTRRPDIVGFVNGLPLVVIEAKRPESGNPNKSMVEEGISQNIRNQKTDEIPQLFAYSQLLFAVSNTNGRYATTKTPRKFWSLWREETLPETHFHTIKNTLIPQPVFDDLFLDKPMAVRRYFQTLWSGEQLPTEQDRLLASLLSKERLLEFIRFFLFFDKKIGKIAARYPQVFGIKALIERINQRTPEGGRKGGILWHTTGSGKSFTMVLLCKALILHESLKDCRVVVVTDRMDLEKQLARTFLTGGAFGSEIASKKHGEKSKVSSGRELAQRIGKGSERIIFSIINKFSTASKLPECYNPSENLIVLVDEGHRSQGGENHERMRKSLPNAAYIAFTGTPLLKKEKARNKFGPIVHAYTMQRAVQDGTVSPLLYEERQPLLDINDKAIDNWFEKITAALNDQQRSDLKEKYGKRGQIYRSTNRIDLIAWDIAVHFKTNFKDMDNGLKGQLATDCKLSAIRYKKALDATGLVSSAVIISPPDTREGHSEVDESELPEVQQWWKNNIIGDPESYERDTIEAFSTDRRPDLLIVVDKLLTGFDEPKNAVLYIDKPLKQHNLIQAIARVNRLHEEKPYGLLIDYRGILKELDTALKDYQELASETQDGYDLKDIEGLYNQVSTEYKRLPSLHDRLRGIFPAVKNKQDMQQYRQVIMPNFETGLDGELYDSHQKIREDFYEALTEFGMCLKAALSSRSFFEDASIGEATIKTYKDDLRFFTNLRQIAKQDAQETVDFSAYEDQIRKLVDRYVVGESIKDSEGIYVVNELGGEENPETWSEEKTRNETDLIKSRVKRIIEQDLVEDPYAQHYFSHLLRQALAEAESLFAHPYKQYALFKDFSERLAESNTEGIPDSIQQDPHLRAYFGIFKLVVDEQLIREQEEAFAEASRRINKTVHRSVAEHSLNPQNIEAEIRKALLPELFSLLGLDKAKQIIDQVIDITRSSISRKSF